MDSDSLFHGHSSSGSFASDNGLQDKVVGITTILRKELSKMKELIDASKGRFDSKSQWKGK